MPKPKTVWLPKKVEQLKKLYATHTQKQIAEKLHISVRAVKCQLTVLALKKRNRGWTKAEDRYLLKHYAAVSKAELAAHFGKKRGAIINRYNKLTRKD